MADGNGHIRPYWEPQEGPQADAIEATWCAELFYGGAAGGGKSDFLLGDFLQDVPTYGAAWRGVIFRRSYPELEELIARSREMFPQTAARYREDTKTWRWGNGASLKMRYLERDADALRYQGHQYTWIGWDELTQWRSMYAYRYLRGRLRSAHGVPTKRIRAAANPGGPSHLEVKGYFIDPAPTGWTPVIDPETGIERMFIPAKLADNRILVSSDPTYRGRLKALGGNLARAMLDGDWDIIEGAFFDNWSQGRNVVRPFAVPGTWTRFVSLDWGSAKPFSVGWWAVCDDPFEVVSANGERLVITRGAMVRYREWYGSNGQPDVGLKMTAEEVARGIRARELLREAYTDETGREHPALYETIAYRIADPAINSSDGGPSIRERMAPLLNWRMADNARVASKGALGGWDQVRARINGDLETDDDGNLLRDGGAMLLVFSTCKDLIRTLPVLQHDPTRPEDVDTAAEDHAADECFVAGTMVETDHGPRRIEELPERGSVVTDRGIRPYLAARRTGRDAALVRLTLSDGRVVVCTPTHRFLVDQPDEWRYASDLEGEEIVCVQPSSVRPFRNLMVSAIIGAADTFSAKVTAFIGASGRPIMALSPMGFTSTTSTATQPITPSKTWKRSALENISHWRTAKRQAGGGARASIRRATPPPLGTAPKQAANGTPSTTTSTSGRSWSAAFLRCAKSAAATIWSAPFKRLMASSAAAPAKRVRCVSVEPLSERADVYCLTVPDGERFAIEGGLIVHNCRYACMSRPYAKAKPPPAPELRTLSSMTFDELLAIQDRREKARTW